MSRFLRSSASHVTTPSSPPSAYGSSEPYHSTAPTPDRASDVSQRGEFLHNLGTTLKNNPVPTTFTVLGLAWLGFNQNRPFNPGPAHTGAGLGEKLGDAVDTLKAKGEQAKEAVKESVKNPPAS